MDIEMPDGTIIEGVPEGVTQKQLLQMLQRAKVDTAVLEGKRKLANDLPWHEAMTVAAGKGGESMWAGLKQLGIGLTGAAANALPDSGVKRSLEDYVTKQAGALDEDQRGKEAEYAVLAQERPYSTGLGEALPMLAIPGGAAVRGARGAELLANAAVQGALPGAIGYGDLGERGSRAAAGGVGGALGGAAGIGIGRAINPIRPAASATRTAAMEAAERFGLKLTPAELTGSRPLKWAQAALDDMPIAAGMGAARRTHNAQTLNRAALQEIGEEGVEITDKALAAGRTKIGAKFEEAFKTERVAMFDGTVDRLAQINDEAIRFLPPDQARVVTNRIDEILGKVEKDGAMPGLSYQKWRASANSKNGDVNKYLKDAKAAVDEAATASLAAEKMAKYKEANRQWGALKTLESGNVVDRATGNVMPKQLDTALANSKYTKDAYREGRLGGNLPDIAKAGSLLREMPQSGTLPRAMYTGGVGGGGTALALGAIDPLTLGLAAASPAMAQVAMNNPLARRYLSKGMFSVTPEMERYLTRAGAMPGAGFALGYSAGSER